MLINAVACITTEAVVGENDYRAATSNVANDNNDDNITPETPCLALSSINKEVFNCLLHENEQLNNISFVDLVVREGITSGFISDHNTEETTATNVSNEKEESASEIQQVLSMITSSNNGTASGEEKQNIQVEETLTTENLLLLNASGK